MPVGFGSALKGSCSPYFNGTLRIIALHLKAEAGEQGSFLIVRNQSGDANTAPGKG
jgi:hypothetical protein